MTNKELLELMGEEDDVLIVDAAPERITKRKYQMLRNMTMIAAGLVFILLAGAGSFAVVADAKEYNEALEFFDDNDLSTEGLSRGEIKAVYQDISSQVFSFSKTAKVIEKSITDSKISGYEIYQGEPSPEDIKELWNFKNRNIQSGNQYRFYSTEKLDESLGFNIHDKSYVEKYDGETLLWKVEFSEFEIIDSKPYKIVDDNMLVYGITPTCSSQQSSSACIAMIDSKGTILWQKKLEHGFQDEYISAVINNGDGTVAVISRGNLNFLCLSQFDIQGKEISTNNTEIGNYGIWNAARLGEGYVVHVGNYIENQDKLVKLNREGIISDTFSYSSKEYLYHIKDMTEYNGKVYLSTYALPTQNEEENVGGRGEIEPILNYLFDNNLMEISSKKLTPMVRKRYTAVLLVCSTDSGTPQEFYSVKGSCGGKLSLNDQGELVWDVESITSTFFSPMTSSFSIGGESNIYQYTFSKTGKLLKQEKTNQIVEFRR